MVGASKPVTGIGGAVAIPEAVETGVNVGSGVGVSDASARGEAVAVAVAVGDVVGDNAPNGEAVGLATTRIGDAVGLWDTASVMVYEPVAVGVRSTSLPSAF